MATKKIRFATEKAALLVQVRELPSFKQGKRDAKSVKAFSRTGPWVVYSPNTASGHYLSTIGNLTGKVTGTHGPAFEAVRAVIKSGLPKSAFDRVKLAIDVSTERLSLLTGIPVRTLARRRKLKPDESDRLFRVALVFQRAVETLENVDAARRWLNAPRRALGNRRPIELCDTEAGAREVENLLIRIDEGVYS